MSGDRITYHGEPGYVEFVATSRPVRRKQTGTFMSIRPVELELWRRDSVESSYIWIMSMKTWNSYHERRAIQRRGSL
jgi:hypothetical protein